MPKLVLACCAVAASVVIAAAAWGFSLDDAEVAPRATPSPLATPSPTPAAPAPPPAGAGLAVGITEFNANLIAAPDRALPEPWSAARDKLTALNPAYFRLVLDWASIQPTPDAPPNLDAPNGGCMRALGPCLGYGGVRDQLRALASRQRAAREAAERGGAAAATPGAWQTLVVVANTPDWAASPAGGCERGGTLPRARPPRADALPAYQALVEAVIAAAANEGATLSFFSPWNEPNHPAFMSPQRAVCDPASPSLAPAAYAQITAALQQALATAPGDQRLVLGETAGLMTDTPHATSVPELIAALPRDLVCATTVWSQHAYIGGRDPVGAAAAALDAFHCPQPHTIWITETGVGLAPKDLSAGARRIADPVEGCRALHDQLVRWYDDPRVTVAFQYTLREDDRFPTGLVSTDLTRDRPALHEWEAWGGARAPTAPPPPAAC